MDLDSPRRSSWSGAITVSDAPPAPNEALAALVRRALAGDRAAVDDLIRRVLCPLLEARVARHLAKRPGGGQDLADRVQQVLLRLFEDDAATLRRWDPARGSLAAYLGAVVDHTMISELRRPAQPEPIEAPDDSRSPDSGPESKAAFQNLMGALVEELGEEEFTLFRLVYMEELSPDEVAALLEVRRDAVYKRIQRLRPRIRELVSRLLSNPEPDMRSVEQVPS